MEAESELQDRAQSWNCDDGVFSRRALPQPGGPAMAGALPNFDSE